MKNKAFLLMLCFGMFCQQNSLLAESAPETVGICDKTPACAELAQRARQLSRGNQLEDALNAYKAAAQISPDPRLLFNIARIMHRLGRLAEAAGYYRRYLDAGAEGSLEQRTKAEEYLARAERGTPVQPTVQTPAELGAPQLSEAALREQAANRTASSPPNFAAVCPRSSRVRNIKIAGWSLVGLGGALVVAAVVPTVISTLSDTCTHVSGTEAQLCVPQPSPPNLLPLSAAGYGLGALTIGGGIGLLVAARKANATEVSRGGVVCLH